MSDRRPDRWVLGDYDDGLTASLAAAAERHDPALVELVASALAACRDMHYDDASAVLDALTDAGYQILPPGGQTREQWAVNLVGAGVLTVPAASEQEAHERARAYNEGAGGDPRIRGEVVRERVYAEVVATYPPADA